MKNWATDQYRQVLCQFKWFWVLSFSHVLGFRGHRSHILDTQQRTQGSILGRCPSVVFRMTLQALLGTPLGRYWPWVGIGFWLEAERYEMKQEPRAVLRLQSPCPDGWSQHGETPIDGPISIYQCLSLFTTSSPLLEKQMNDKGSAITWPADLLRVWTQLLYWLILPSDLHLLSNIFFKLVCCNSSPGDPQCAGLCPCLVLTHFIQPIIKPLISRYQVV